MTNINTHMTNTLPNLRLMTLIKRMSLMGCLLGLSACSQQSVKTISDMVNTPNNQPIGSQQHSQIGHKTFQKIIDTTEIPTATTTIDCANIQPNQSIRIKGHTKLSEQCNLSGKSVKFILDTSNTSLDCRGAMLSQLANDSSKTSAITIRPKVNKDIYNITVANCHVQGYSHALHIRQKTNPNVRYLKGLTDIESNRKTAPHDIRIINISTNGSKTSGIYVDDHSYKVHFSDLLVRASGTVGLYFEFGTQNNRVEDSVFVDNGFRTFKPNREAIAVDSSAGNVITGNRFIHNGLGGIMLYRNCFEHAHDSNKSNHFKRTQSSRDNLIANNTFENEPVGVWVASRQSRNLIGLQCGAYTLKKTSLASYHLDSAKNNQIIGNQFINVTDGIIVEDDGTLIQDNDFTKVAGVAVSVGSAIREASPPAKGGGAVKNTRIIGNQLDTQSAVKQIQIRQASESSTVVK